MAETSGLCVLHQPPHAHADQIVETELKPSAVAQASAAEQNALNFIRASITVACLREGFMRDEACRDSKGKVAFYEA